MPRLVEFWSTALDNEIRDDQGISKRNPDTGSPVQYAGGCLRFEHCAVTTTDRSSSPFEEMAVIRKPALMAPTGD